MPEIPQRFIVDPIDDSYAIDTKRPERHLSALRWLPANPDKPPTVAELMGAPILGYCAPEDITIRPDGERP